MIDDDIKFDDMKFLRFFEIIIMQLFFPCPSDINILSKD